LSLLILGLCLSLPQKTSGLWQLWMTDPLRSIGIIMPLAALYFFIQSSPNVDWTQGSWWGVAWMIAPMVWTMCLGSTASISGPMWGRTIGLSLVPTGVLIAMYFSGAIVWWGGMSAWRRLRFPLCLLLLVNPVPSLVNALDLQLQTIAAVTARGFAHLIALPVEPGLLQMMFTPQLGMFIAPECNGLRSMATMLCLSMIWGRVHRLSPIQHAMYVVSAVALAELMNLVRLCLVVIYYWFAVRWDAIASLGEEIDNVIGGVVFFALALFVFVWPAKLKNDR
jgi:exosortase J